MLTRIFLITIVLLSTAWVHASEVASGSANESSSESSSEPAAVSSADELVKTSCLNIANKLASVKLAECMARDLQTSGYYSAHQAPLLFKEYHPLLNKRQPQAKILILGGIHGDEYSSVTIMFKWMSILDQYHSGLFHWKIAPLVNPDGLLQIKSQRMNANGVDLNRNFPNKTNPQASLEHWKKSAYSDRRRYPGPDPMSESETKWVVDLIKEFQPDAIVAVHAPYGIVDFDGPPEPPPRLGSLHLQLLGTYPGSLGNYAGLQQQIPVVTVELPHAGIMPKPQEVNRIWTDLVRWLKNNIPQKASQEEVLEVEVHPNSAQSG